MRCVKVYRTTCVRLCGGIMCEGTVGCVDVGVEWGTYGKVRCWRYSGSV